MKYKINIFTALFLLSSMPTWAAEVRLSFVEGHTSIEDREVNPNIITNQNKHIKRWITPLKADEMNQLVVGISMGNKCTADSAGFSLPGSFINNNTITVTSDKPYMVRGHRLVDGVRGEVCIRHPSFKGVNTEFRAGDSATVTLYRK
jgi:hypothetical protein